MILHNRLTRDWTAKTVSRDQILRREQGQRTIHFSCSADHKQAGNLTQLILTLTICDDNIWELIRIILF